MGSACQSDSTASSGGATLGGQRSITRFEGGMPRAKGRRDILPASGQGEGTTRAAKVLRDRILRLCPVQTRVAEKYDFRAPYQSLRVSHW